MSTGQVIEALTQAVSDLQLRQIADHINALDLECDAPGPVFDGAGPACPVRDEEGWREDIRPEDEHAGVLLRKLAAESAARGDADFDYTYGEGDYGEPDEHQLVADLLAEAKARKGGAA